ncbi:hypothetical protein GCM10025868_17960 [Angustibacter aerolatus]|uniref:Nudix hydrolase domain-containing protein n=1 Tax=Angustibacter aerolatus TaxID=1162965 RepID=A0ABQ6JEB6_9ACTN|nr:hypothetical protein [Angustibacter aerolatus]GMA86546.1 hypothetical protein GCM10025868_17960 [Angustibacter aerolatus]
MALLRDGDHGPEAFLLRRKASMAFAARMHVFPGGGVDPRDDDADVPWAGPPLDDWAQRLGVGPGTAAGLVCAAVREPVRGVGRAARRAGRRCRGRRHVRAGVGGRPAGAARPRARAVAGCSCAAGWCCAPTCSRRGRTGARRSSSRGATTPGSSSPSLPAGQVARDVGGEADEVAWLPASDALAGHERGE